MDKKKWGGKRKGAGRKSKAEEYKLIERLDEQIEPKKAIGVLKELIEKKDKQALQIYLGYRFGKPTEHKKIELEPMQPIFDLSGPLELDEEE